MTTKLHFIWSKTPLESHHGVVHIHDSDGELRHRASPTGTVDVRPGQYRLRVQVAGRETADSSLIDVSGESKTIDLDAVLPSFRAFQPRPSFQGGESGQSSPFGRHWRLETWAGNVFRGGLKKVASLGRWDGRFPVSLPAASEATLFVRIAAVDDPAQLLVAVPAASEGAASLSADGVRSSSATDDRALMQVESLNPAVRMLLGWQRSGAMSDAVRMAPQLAADLIGSQQKKSDPVGAAIGCDFLLNVVDRRNDPDQLWPLLSKAINGLGSYERWLPDSAVLAASVAAIQGHYPTAAGYLRRLDALGPPILTSGLIRAVDLARLVAAHLPDDDSDRASLAALRSRLVDIAVDADLSRQYLTLQDVSPESTAAV